MHTLDLSCLGVCTMGGKAFSSFFLFFFFYSGLGVDCGRHNDVFLNRLCVAAIMTCSLTDSVWPP